MAEAKKSFILYADLIGVVKKLVLQDRANKTNYAGELFLHVLEYVNDNEPIPVDFIIDMAFEPIKAQLKRDLKKWGKKTGKKSDAGLKSAGVKAFRKEILNEKWKTLTLVDHQNEAGRCYKYMNENHDSHLFYYYQSFREWHLEEIEKINTKSTQSTEINSVDCVATESTVNVNVSVNDNVNVSDTVILLEKETKKDSVSELKIPQPPPEEKKFNFKKSLSDYGFKENLISDFLAIRKKKKATNTETAFKGFVREVAKTGHDPNDILELCIERDWKAFNNNWDWKIEENGTAKNNNNQQQPKRKPRTESHIEAYSTSKLGKSG